MGNALRDIEALHDVAFEVGHEMDPQRLADFAVGRARELLGVDTASLMWWDPAAGVLRRMARNKVGGAPGPEVVRPGDAVSGVAFQRREPVLVDDVLTWPDRPKAGSGHRSAMAVPLMIGQRVVGSLFVGSIGPRIFTPDEARVLSVLGAEVAPAIEMSHLLAAAQRAASIDPLTGLPNRAALTEGVAGELREALATGRSVAIMYVDLDDFRSVLDAFGTAAGHEVLCQVPERIRSIGGLAKAVARFGDDEFAVCLPLGSGAAEARRAAELTLAAMSEPFVVAGQPVHVVVNVGLVVSDGQGESAEGILRKAERAMMAAKRSGSRYALYGPELDPRSQEKLALLTDLRAAIATGQLFLRYEPQICLTSERLAGVEALVRWRHPERGVIPPSVFVPIAEESGLIVELTEWVIDRALSELPLWHGNAEEVRLSVNVGMRNLRDPSFVGTVEGALRRHAVPGEVLTLEVTESTVMLEPERTLATLRRLRSLAVAVSVDDFGTGYSSLGLLGRLPVDEVKVDRAFVARVNEKRGGAVMRALVELGCAFDLRVVAEGVEDPLTLAALRGLGCAVAQGYLFSRPIPAAELAAWTERPRVAVA